MDALFITFIFMFKNKIYINYFFEIFKTFLTIILGLSLIAFTVRAVNFLELIVDNGYSLNTYFKYSIFNIFGIAPKFFPLAFLVSISIFLFKHNNNSEFVILWTTGVKKIVIVNLLLVSSFIIIILYLIFSVYLTPLALNKSREMISDSEFNSFLPTIRSQNFSDSFKNLTFLVEKKIDNELKNIFLHDTGKNLKNFPSSSTDISSTTIIAEKGVVEKKYLFLINGEIIKTLRTRNLSSFEKPNRLVIGGCDKKTKLQIINALSQSMSIGDIIVIPIIDIQTIKELKEELEDKNFKTNLNLIQTYKSLSIAEGMRLEPNNPVFLLTGKK